MNAPRALVLRFVNLRTFALAVGAILLAGVSLAQTCNSDCLAAALAPQATRPAGNWSAYLGCTSGAQQCWDNLELADQLSWVKTEQRGREMGSAAHFL
jgi:hypothetical protein